MSKTGEIVESGTLHNLFQLVGILARPKDRPFGVKRPFLVLAFAVVSISSAFFAKVDVEFLNRKTPKGNKIKNRADKVPRSN